MRKTGKSIPGVVMVTFGIALGTAIFNDGKLLRNAEFGPDLFIVGAALAAVKDN
jgi:hypothetical protein